MPPPQEDPCVRRHSRTRVATSKKGPPKRIVRTAPKATSPPPAKKTNEWWPSDLSSTDTEEEAAPRKRGKFQPERQNPKPTQKDPFHGIEEELAKRERTTKRTSFLTEGPIGPVSVLLRPNGTARLRYQNLTKEILLK